VARVPRDFWRNRRERIPSARPAYNSAGRSTQRSVFVARVARRARARYLRRDALPRTHVRSRMHSSKTIELASIGTTLLRRWSQRRSIPLTTHPMSWRAKRASVRLACSGGALQTETLDPLTTHPISWRAKRASVRLAFSGCALQTETLDPPYDTPDVVAREARICPACSAGVALCKRYDRVGPRADARLRRGCAARPKRRSRRSLDFRLRAGCARLARPNATAFDDARRGGYRAASRFGVASHLKWSGRSRVANAVLSHELRRDFIKPNTRASTSSLEARAVRGSCGAAAARPSRIGANARSKSEVNISSTRPAL